MATKENENQDTMVVLTADEEKREICSNADDSELAPVVCRGSPEIAIPYTKSRIRASSRYSTTKK